MLSNVALIPAKKSTYDLYSYFSNYFTTYPHMFSIGLRSGEFEGQNIGTKSSWLFNHFSTTEAVWGGALSC